MNGLIPPLELNKDVFINHIDLNEENWILDNYETLCKMFKLEEIECSIILLSIFIHPSFWVIEQNKKYLIQISWKDETWFSIERPKELKNLRRLGLHYMTLYLGSIDEKNGKSVEISVQV